MATEPTSRETNFSRPLQRRVDEVVAALAERIGGQFAASNVFGAPVERDGITVIPVAAVRFGLGAGSGSDSRKSQNGEGGGGGGSATAVGYIEIKHGRTRFVPVVHPARMLALVAAATLLGLAIVHPPVSRPSTRLPWR